MITLDELMNLYDDWNGIIKVNDFHLSEIVSCQTSDLMLNSEFRKIYDKIHDKQVASFGFDLSENKIYVRLYYIRVDDSDEIWLKEEHDEFGNRLGKPDTRD